MRASRGKPAESVRAGQNRGCGGSLFTRLIRYLHRNLGSFHEFSVRWNILLQLSDHSSDSLSLPLWRLAQACEGSRTGEWWPSPGRISLEIPRRGVWSGETAVRANPARRLRPGRQLSGDVPPQSPSRARDGRLLFRVSLASCAGGFCPVAPT